MKTYLNIWRLVVEMGFATDGLWHRTDGHHRDYYIARWSVLRRGDLYAMQVIVGPFLITFGVV